VAAWLLTLVMCAGLACSKPKVKILMLDDDGAVLLVAKVHVPHLDYSDRGPIAELAMMITEMQHRGVVVCVCCVYLLTCFFASCGGPVAW
jgi:hypothetical protein